MRAKWSIAILFISLLLSACGPLGLADTASPTSLRTIPGDPAVTSSVAITDHDLNDPELLVRLGSPPFDDANWQRTVDGLTILGDTSGAVPDELELIAAALSQIPDALADVSRPRNLIRVDAVSGEEAIGKAVAFTKGPDIYLVNRSFAPNADTTTLLELTRAMLHELTHVAQYYALDGAYVDAALAGKLDQVDPAAGSTLVWSFADSIGWIDQDADPNQVAWFLPDAIEPATAYGRTGAGEDMAEAVSMVALGRSNWIPASHTRWVEQWLGTSAIALAAGKPWAPAGSEEVLAREPIYEEAELDRAALGFTHREPLYFQLPPEVDRHELLAAAIQQHLLERGMSGVLTRTNDDRLPRYSGLFTFGNGLRFWVELWDFRDAPGFSSSPTNPILTYVALW